MRMPYVSLGLLLLLSCGKHTSSTAQHIQIQNPEWKMFSVPSEIDSADMDKISDLLPTMYYTPREDGVRCAGGYGRTRYTGKETTKLLTPDGSVIATVCKRFASTLLMEGSAILKDRGDGEIAVNYGGEVKGQPRYHLLGRCRFGEGIHKDLCLLPYHTIAADNKVHQIDEIIYVPAAKGIHLPDGTEHDGFFIVRDTGGAFNGIGAQRVDMFTGTDPDYENAFQKAGFDHHRPLDAFKIRGESAEYVKQKFHKQFGELY